MGQKTQAQHITAVRDLLDEASARQWTEEQLRRWINEAAKDICKRTECKRGTENVTAVAGTQTYTLTNPIVRLHRVEYRATGDTAVYPLEYVDFMNMDDVWWTGQEQGSGIPCYYTTWGVPPALTLTVYPIPAVGGTFKVFKYALPTDLAISTSADAAVAVDVPDGWESLVTEYVVMMALRKDRDPRWTDAKQLYDDQLKELNELAIRYNDQAGMVAMFNGAGVPRWLYDEAYPV